MLYQAPFVRVFSIITLLGEGISQVVVFPWGMEPGIMNPQLLITRAGILVLSVSVPTILPWTCTQIVLLMNSFTDILPISLVPCHGVQLFKTWEELWWHEALLFVSIRNESTGWKWYRDLLIYFSCCRWRLIWVFCIFCKAFLLNIYLTFKLAPMVLLTKRGTNVFGFLVGYVAIFFPFLFGHKLYNFSIV